MRRLAIAFFLAVLAAPLVAEAQSGGKVYRIGVLRTGSPPPAPDPLLEAFRQGLRELGYVEGKNIVLELRWVEGKVDRLPALAADLVRLRVDVIVASGSEAVQAARNATSTIPIVMAFVGYPLELRLIASLARPGGNVTGLSNLNHELDVKRLERLKEVVPQIARIAVLWNPPQPAHEGQLKHLELAARSLGVQLQPVAVRAPEDLDGAFAAIRRERAGAVTMLPSALHAQNARRIAGLALKARLPTISWQREFPGVGGLMGYGVNQADMTRRAATYVDRILKDSEGRNERLPALAAELVRLNVDLIVASGGPPPHAAKRATSTIPIVVTNHSDPLGTGLVDSLARPGGNVTGLSITNPDILGKQLQLLKEVVPRISRVAVLSNPTNPTHPLSLRQVGAAAQSLKLRLHILQAAAPGDFEGAFSWAMRESAGALVILGDPMYFAQRTSIGELGARNRLPVMATQREHAEAGALLTYGANLRVNFRRAATYVDKILKGARPGDLPIEQPTKFEFVVNAKTAKALGLTIPPSVLVRADEIIQ